MLSDESTIVNLLKNKDGKLIVTRMDKQDDRFLGQKICPPENT